MAKARCAKAKARHAKAKVNYTRPPLVMPPHGASALPTNGHSDFVTFLQIPDNDAMVLSQDNFPDRDSLEYHDSDQGSLEQDRGSLEQEHSDPDKHSD
ncbi:hypothetical protein Lalb_Chr09g0324911 [Lupinus albus]|uniref:Uncharacterized protein n=1 Tax=Lupinus albus TaxID=3870 RepID=A0A6A4Q0A9_LUPAL|nr:hypothetical protein Lalb_Chr09g0324911 [Lupinus albus]